MCVSSCMFSVASGLMVPVYLSGAFSASACLELPLKLKNGGMSLMSPYPHLCLAAEHTMGWFLVLRICVFILIWCSRFPEVWKWRGVCLAQSASVSLLSVDVWGSCVAGWLAPARARLPNRFSFCRLGPCSALSSSCVTFPQHWRRRRGSSFFPDCGRFCLTDNSMWVYISYPALENVVIAFKKFLWKILIKFQGMKKLLSCQSEVSKVGRCCVRESRCADFRMKTKINFVFGFRLWPVRLAHSCAVAVTRCSGIVSQVHWTALWKPCPSASLRFPLDPAFWSTWGKHTTFGFAPH